VLSRPRSQPPPDHRPPHPPQRLPPHLRQHHPGGGGRYPYRDNPFLPGPR
jgi:hypothetical protein